MKLCVGRCPGEKPGPIHPVLVPPTDGPRLSAENVQYGLSSPSPNISCYPAEQSCLCAIVHMHGAAWAEAKVRLRRSGVGRGGGQPAGRCASLPASRAADQDRPAGCGGDRPFRRDVCAAHWQTRSGSAWCLVAIPLSTQFLGPPSARWIGTGASREALRATTSRCGG